MEQVIRAYGKFLLEAAVAALLLGILFSGLTDENGNQGIFHMMGAYIREEETATARSDFECCQNESTKSAPAITYVATGMLHRGSCRVDSILKAIDYSGQALPICIKSISNPNGIERIGEYLPAVMEVQFVERGIYSLKVSAKDAWNRTSICEIHIPVNE